MKMKRLLLTLAIALLAIPTLPARDDEVIVTRQLTMGQRNSLPEKTITVETKRLSFNKKADAALTEAVTLVMDTIAREDYLNRTFVLLLEPKPDGTIGIAVRDDEVMTRGKQNEDFCFGCIEHQRHYFAVLTGQHNAELLERTFKREGKVKFVQEFEFVDFPTPHYPTNVIARWSPGKELQWLTVIINEDPYADHEQKENPAHFQN